VVLGEAEPLILADGLHFAESTPKPGILTIVVIPGYE
jgi:hypothetical protein